MDIAYFVGLLILPIVVSLVAIGMRLYKRSRPISIKSYIIVYVVYIVLIGINSLMPFETKITAFILAAVILGTGYLVDKKLKI
ncbi:hypothetical protein [Acinetobacter higginsii]|uniref:hypothetical protein n=1 Tax=Acinetobacter higginsii TaxID=70347 RepID=UPI001F4A0C51|nr:hypothetical protein [Acinetobacter higginsii]MCH7295473.1 hypothetical protein [Acinetobacter higginsii]